MNKLPLAKQAAILRGLTEGVPIRAVARMTDVSKTTILKLLVDVGEMAALYQDHKLRNLSCKRIEADEIWAFVGMKQKRAKGVMGSGDAWTFTALDADTKLMVSWLVGPRNMDTAYEFMQDVKSRMTNRIQLTTDGHSMYFAAVGAAFNDDVDYPQLVKYYGVDPNAPVGKYSPPICLGTEKKWISGSPDYEKVSTSYVERSNLTLRTQNRRFTRLTNGFSRKMENHAHSVALFFFAYNFCKPHTTLTKAAKGIHTTPAMAAGVTDHIWTMEELLDLMDPEKSLQ